MIFTTHYFDNMGKPRSFSGPRIVKPDDEPYWIDEDDEDEEDDDELNVFEDIFERDRNDRRLSE